MKIEVKKGIGYWYWRIVAKNAEILARSEMYTTKAKCLKTARFVAKAKFTVEVVK